MSFLSVFTIIVVLVFIVYWFIKFYQVIPLYSRIEYLDKFYVKFDEFVSSTLSVSANLSRQDHINLINMIFIKLTSIFSDISVYLFEEKDGQWTYIGGVNNEGDEIDFSEIEKNISSIKDDIIVVEKGTLFEGKHKKFILMPLFTSTRKIISAINIGDEDKNCILHYLKFMLSFFRFLNNYYESLYRISDENKKLKIEIDSVIKELENQGSRLIKKSKESKIFYEGITSFSSDDMGKTIKHLVELIYNTITPTFVIYYSYNEMEKKLSPNSYAPGNLNIANYSIDLGDYDSLIVKSFLNKNTLYVYDEKNISDKIFLDNKIKTAVILPIYSPKNKFGVLVAGFSEKKEISLDDIRLMEIISKELAVMVNLFELYRNISIDAANLANLNKIKDEFISTINHEIKTPLTTIKGFVSILLNGEAGELNEQQNAFLNMVGQATDRLIGIVTNLLDISRLNSEQDIELEKNDLIEIVDNSLKSLQFKSYLKKIKINFNHNSDKVYVMVDKRWILQAVMNLVDNAIKYSPGGSEVNVNIHDRGSVVVFSVSDSGYGISEEDKKYIFEKFYRSKDIMLNTDGTGLGLSIAKSIIEKHNGRIWFESEKGKGSTFYFALAKAK
ncbi:MAG: HAMP domain-containing histidine kinase [Elusimicrobiota bacterium]